MQIDQKWELLRSLLGEMERAVIAYSGGVDSSLLLKAAAEVLGPRVLAVTAVSETYPAGELEQAQEFARMAGVRHLVLQTDELSNDAFSRNSPDRCYHCKEELFSRLREIADGEDIPFVLDGSNADDLNDYRPGRKAAREHAVLSPLADAGLAKAEIRQLARRMSLPLWDKPALACLSSRIPYGTRITTDLLKAVQAAEDAVRSFGFGSVRVRHHGNTARIEVLPAEFGRMFSTGTAEKLTAAIKKIGYTYVCLDLEGYRTGSMNESLIGPETDKSQESCVVTPQTP